MPGERLRALILSDIHSNLEALAAVIGDAQQRGGLDCVWCLGDMVGYGRNRPHPHWPGDARIAVQFVIKGEK